MATAEQLGSAFIDLSYRGFDKLKSGMGQIKSVVGEVGKSFDAVASKATTAFASLSGTLLATTRSASPAVFDMFTGSLKALSIVIGATLAPILVEVTGYVIQAISWWAKLDSGTKENIQTFVKWGLAITGAIMALSTLNSVFGGFATAAIKFAITNPLLAAFLAIAAVVTTLYLKLDALNKKTLENIKNAKRLKDGDINEDDIKQSWTAKDLMAIQDPKERAKAAQDVIDKETARMHKATNKTIGQDSFGLGLSRIGQAMGFNTETAELDKIQTDAGRNIGIATDILNKAKQGKDIAVKPAPSKMGLYDNIGNLGMHQKAVGVGGIADLWKSIQTAQQEDPSLKILNKMGILQQTNNELLDGIKKQLERQNEAMPVPAVGGI